MLDLLVAAKTGTDLHQDDKSAHGPLLVLWPSSTSYHAPLASLCCFFHSSDPLILIKVSHPIPLLDNSGCIVCRHVRRAIQLQGAGVTVLAASLYRLTGRPNKAMHTVSTCR